MMHPNLEGKREGKKEKNFGWKCLRPSCSPRQGGQGVIEPKPLSEKSYVSQEDV